MSLVLETKGLTKHFGRIKAVQSMDLQISAGSVFGILGPNGSGKTTTLGMLLGVTRKTSGSFSWFEQGEGNEARKRIGAILEHPIFYPFLNAMDNLQISAHIKDVKKPDYEGLLKLVGLYDRRKDAFKTYSLGMKQRLAIGAALISDPEFLIFDEPTNGLDPQGIADIRKLVLEIADTGKTILIASHLLDEVQKVCTDFAVLRMGEKIYQGSVADVLNNNPRVEIAAENVETLKQHLLENRMLANIEIEDDLIVADLLDDAATADLNQFLFDRGVVVSHLALVRSTLEEKFLAILDDD